MKRILFLVLPIFAIQTYAQDIIINFSGEILETETPVTLDSVKIENLSQDASITIPGDSGFNLTTGEIVTVPMIAEYSIIQVYPNPFHTSANINFYVKDYGKVHIMVSNIAGQLVADWSKQLTSGTHNCNFIPENNGIYLFNIQMDETTLTSKAISLSAGNAKSKILYQHQVQTETHNTMLKTGSNKDFLFTVGDTLKYSGYYADYITYIVNNPSVSTSYTFGLDYQRIKLATHTIEEVADYAVWRTDYYICTGISYAKSLGETADDFAWFVGNSHSLESMWGQGLEPAVQLLNFIITNYENGNFEILSETDSLVTMRSNRPYAEYFNYPMLDVTLEEFESCLWGHIVILFDRIDLDFVYHIEGNSIMYSLSIRE
ncbi:MAG: T9SS type A sorting domain-containing protein [Bacteroidales bacterium]|nr:T9SS type A sorting domain-containing protein [Bacteroidales bacterium]